MLLHSLLSLLKTRIFIKKLNFPKFQDEAGLSTNYLPDIPKISKYDLFSYKQLLNSKEKKSYILHFKIGFFLYFI